MFSKVKIYRNANIIKLPLRFLRRRQKAHKKVRKVKTKGICSDFVIFTIIKVVDFALSENILDSPMAGFSMTGTCVVVRISLFCTIRWSVPLEFTSWQLAVISLNGSSSEI